MKKVVILLVFIVVPVLSFGQQKSDDKVTQKDDISVEILSIQHDAPELALETLSKNQVNYLSYKKSIELISIKAYRKSLQIKVKEVKPC